MSFRSKRELLAQVAPRYQQARHRQKSVILDEFIAVTGYGRKYAIRLLTRPPLPPLEHIRRPRPPHYGPAVQAVLATAWAATNYIGPKRLGAFLPTLIPHLERHHYLTLTDEVRRQVLTLSPATADRLLQPLRAAGQPQGVPHCVRDDFLTVTKAGVRPKRREWLPLGVSQRFGRHRSRGRYLVNTSAQQGIAPNSSHVT